MVQAGLIKFKSFSLRLGEKPRITFGIDVNKDSEHYHWHQILDAQYWAIRLGGASYGSKSLHLRTYKAIIDSGSSNIIIPPKDFEELKKIVKSENKWSHCGHDHLNRGLFFCSCLF